MRLRLAFAPLLAVLAALTVPTHAGAVTLTGVTTDADHHQTFSVSVPAGEERGYLEVSASPTVLADGSFPDAVAFDRLPDGASTFRNDYPLKPGTYYAMATASSLDTFEQHRTPMIQFVVPAKFEQAASTLTCVGRKRLVMRNGWRTNVPDLKYAAVIRYRKKVVASEKYTEFLPGSLVGTMIREDSTWTPLFARVFPKNAVYTMTVTVTGPGVAYKRVVSARCR